MRQAAGGLGMGVGKQKDWARRYKVTYLVNRSRSIDEKKKKKNRISAEKLLNNFNNCRNGVQTKVVN